MTYPDYCYSELVLGGYKGKARNNVLGGKEFNSALKGNIKAGCYRNMFRFTKDYQDYVRDTGSVKGYAGPCYSDFFWLAAFCPWILLMSPRSRGIFTFSL